MRYVNLLLTVVALVVANTQSVTTAERVSTSAERSLRRNRFEETGDAESEERMPDLSAATSFSKKEAGIVKNLKENPVLTKTLSRNPSLVKSFENNPQLASTVQSLQKDTALMARMASLGRSPSMKKVASTISRNPSALTKNNVEKLGAAVLKPSGKLSEQDRGVLFACGLMLLVIGGGTITIAVTAGSRL